MEEDGKSLNHSFIRNKLLQLYAVFESTKNDHFEQFKRQKLGLSNSLKIAQAEFTVRFKPLPEFPTQI